MSIEHLLHVPIVAKNIAMLSRFYGRVKDFRNLLPRYVALNHISAVVIFRSPSDRDWETLLCFLQQ